jgi:hypothetical protein
MVGLGISRQGSVSASGSASTSGQATLGDRRDGGDVFGGSGSSHLFARDERDRAGRSGDTTLEEVDQFLQDAGEDEDGDDEGTTFDLKHSDQKRSSRSTTKLEFNMPRRNDSSHSSLQSHRSHASDPLLEVLDDDDYGDDGGDEGEGMEIFDNDEDEDEEAGAGIGGHGPGRRSRRGRRRWNEDEGNGEAGLLEVSPLPARDVEIS